MHIQNEFLTSQSPSLQSRALNYGDGCFTTMLSNKGRVELLDDHVERLRADTKKLSIFDSSDRAFIESLKTLIKDAAKKAYEEGNSDQQIVKILIARGDSERGYAPSQTSLPNIFSSYQNYPSQTHPSSILAIAQMTLADQSIIAGVKHLNRLEQVFAKMELMKHEGIDDLVLTRRNRIMCELTSSNFFYRLDGIWHTPCVKNAGVNGVMRQYILRYMQQNKIHCVVSEMSVDALEDADAAFSCNAVTKVVPIAQIKLGDQYHLLDTDVCKELAVNLKHEINKEGR